MTLGRLPRRERGELAIVLHSHMPYVEGFDTWPFGEEWLFEALASVYLPLLDSLRGAPVTVGLTPVLCDQLEALEGEAGDRFLNFLRDVRAPIHAEDAATFEQRGDHDLAEVVRRGATDYTNAERTFLEADRQILGRLHELATRGELALWCGPATHPILPLLASDAGIRLQIETGISAHERRFDAWSGGFWLPECAYDGGLAHHLAEFGVATFCVDQTEPLGLGSLDHLEPIATPAGPVAVPIDWQLVSLVWENGGGYPAGPAYRDYHGLTEHHIRAWNVAGEPYRQHEALVLARQHARDFVERVCARLDAYREERGRPGLVCFALDTELLGHWWYEGGWWLRFVIDEARRQGVALATLPDALERHPAVEREIAPSSWGRPKDLSTWDSPKVADIAFGARTAELRVVHAAGRGGGGSSLERAARELLALQSSDWAFHVTHDVAAAYGRKRFEEHLAALETALSSTDGAEPHVRNLAPDLDVSPLFGL
jgi:1,4-alpha-glucan branching enzyme